MLFTKEQPWASELLFCSQKTSDLLEKILFIPCFYQFFTAFPLFRPKSKSLPMLFVRSLFFKEQREWFALVALYKRVTVSELLLSLFTKEQPWAVCSRCSLQKSGGSDSPESLFFSFAHKKRAIRLKNQRANSQPWLCVDNGHSFLVTGTAFMRIFNLFLGQYAGQLKVS